MSAPDPTPALYLDLYVDDVLVLAGVPCLHGVKLVRDAYHGFSGNLAFFDSQGSADPEYADLGGRWFLAYLEPGVDL